MKSSREALRESAKELQALKAIINSNRAALATAQIQAETAEAASVSFDGLNAKISQWRASEIRAKRRPGRLPQALRDKQEARQAAQEELSLARETAELIAADLREDEAKLTRLQADITPVAAAVVHEEVVAELAAELIAINRRQFELKAIIQGWYTLQVVGANGWEALGRQDDVLEALTPYVGPQFIISASPAEEQTQRFKQLVTNLIADPAAEIAAPKLVIPSDFYQQA